MNCFSFVDTLVFDNKTKQTNKKQNKLEFSLLFPFLIQASKFRS